MPLLWWSKKTREEKLWVAVKRGDSVTVQQLLKRRSIDANALDHTDTAGMMAPLHHAALNGKDDIVRSLLDAGAYIDARDERERTPLFNAVVNHYVITVRLLLSRGAGVNAVNYLGETPLFEARSKEIVQALVEGGADIYWRNTIGSMALHAKISMWGGSWEVIDALLNAGVSIHCVDKNGNTALHFAAMQKAGVRVMEKLIERGASASTQNNRRQTPLHYACHGEDGEGIACLLQAGADPHIRDEDGLQAFHTLVRSAFAYEQVEYHTLRCFRLLVSRGARWDSLCEKLLVLLRARNNSQRPGGLAPEDTNKLVRNVWSTGTQMSMNIAYAVQVCILQWAQEHSKGLSLTEITSEVVNRGVKATMAFLQPINTKPEEDSVLYPD